MAPGHLLGLLGCPSSGFGLLAVPWEVRRVDMEEVQWVTAHSPQGMLDSWAGLADRGRA